MTRRGSEGQTLAASDTLPLHNVDPRLLHLQHHRAEIHHRSIDQETKLVAL